MRHFPFLLLLLAPLIATNSANAQDDNSLRLGFKVAPNTAWLRPDSKGLESDGNKSGISFGVIMDIPFGANGTYAFHTGFMLNNIGGKLKATFTDANSASVVTTQDVSLRYLEIPLCLKLQTKTASPLDFYGLFGTSGAFNLRARSDYSTTVGGVTTSDTDENIIDDVALFKMALVVGAGAQYELGSGMLIFGGLTYNNSFINTLQGDTKYIVNGDKKSKLYADYLEVSLGIYL